ncbi:MAG TPA: ATP-binding protein [Rhizomicrobium sp.]|nr:ATP-binding protein [Rhizomicrobium sp.]
MLEMEVTSLFNASGPIDEEHFFAGRSKQVRQLMEAVFERSRHAVLFGERGVGKTSLGNIFWKRFSPNLQSVIAARIQADPSDNFTSLWIKGLRELKSNATARGRGDQLPLDTNFDVLSPDDIRREFQKASPNSLPILIIDEFDKIEDPSVIQLVANTIKYLSDYSVTATIVIVGVAESLAELIKEHESIKRCLTQVPLERMDTAELREIVEKRLGETPMKITGDAKWKIIMLARGLPFYVHILSKYAVSAAIRRHSLEIAEVDVDVAIERFINETDQTFYDDYQTAVSTHQPDNLFQEVLLACAIADSDERGFFTPTNVIDPLSRILGKRVEIANFQRHLNEFVQPGRGNVLIRKGKERQYKYRFRDPMMQPYVVIKGIYEDMIDEQTRATLRFPEQGELSITR